MAHKSPRRRGALQQAKEYLRVNPSASNAQVIEVLNVSVATVSAARSFLVQTGVIPRSYYDRSSALLDPEGRSCDSLPGSIEPTSGVADLAKQAARDKIEQIIAGEPLSPEEQRQRLSAVARRAAIEANFQLEIAAIQALARLDAQIGARDRLGPGPPLNDDDKIHRLALLLESQGKRIARKAWERAFSEQLHSQSETQIGKTDREPGGSPEGALLVAPADGDSARISGAQGPQAG